MAIYKYKDFTYSQEEIEEKVDTLDISFEDYLIKNDIKKVEEEVVEASSPVVEEDFQTDTAVSADVVSTDVPALDTNTELDSVDISSVSSDPDPEVVLTQQEFDSILPEGDEVPNEDKITESLNSMFRGKGVGVEVDIPMRPGADVITLTNIETGATTEIPLYTDITGDTFGSRNRIKNPEAYSEIANFLANQPKTDGYVGNVYKNTGIAPENYFTEETDRSPNMDSISSQIE
jgi:hypothetical protein